MRKIKAYCTYKAWASDPNYIKWLGACGMFEGLAETYKVFGNLIGLKNVKNYINWNNTFAKFERFKIKQ